MFGLSFGELVVVLLVALLVMGPEELPRILKKAGQWAGKLRRMAYDLRAQSGIDEVLQAEGIGDDLREITKLARGELDGVATAARFDTTTLAAAAAASPALAPPRPPAPVTVHREREYPTEGADARGAMPDTAIVYGGDGTASAHATDSMYTADIPTPAAAAPFHAPQPVLAGAPKGEEGP